jgi:MOSC domain-containing protein YiiM
LVAGEGVAGDVHRGTTIRHLSRMRRDPSRPNLRQVHLLDAELLDELAARDMPVAPGEMGENVLIRGLGLLALPAGTVLLLGATGEVEITGLRNPCHALDDLHQGLMEATIERDHDGQLVCKAGIMGVIRSGGVFRVGDGVDVTEMPAHRSPLQPV